MVDTSADLQLKDIAVGSRASFSHRVTVEDVDRFARLSGDMNPLHTDEDYASNTSFGQRVVHGMFLASLLSRMVGMYLPGRRCLYLSQSLDFVQPVFIGDTVRVSVEVLQKQEATKTLVLRTEIHSLPDKLVVRGKAHVQVLE